MASLSNTKISDTYPLLLKIETNGVDGTLRSIEDGDGTTSALKISSGAIQVDNIKVDGNAITSTDTNGNIDLTPNGSGEVNISKVDIDSGAIDGTPIGANSANTGAFTTLTASGDVTISNKIVHSGDTDTFLSFGDDSLSLFTGNASASVVDFIYGNIYIKGNNKALIGYTTGASAKELIKIDNSDVVQIGEGLNTTFAGNILMGNTVVNPASGFADQTGIGLKYSSTVPELQVSSDSTAMQLGRTTTGGDGQILAMRKASVTVHSFETNAVSIGTDATFASSITQGSGTLTIKNASGDSNGLKIYQDSSDVARIYNHYNGELVFGVNNAEKLSIDGGTNVTIGTFNMTNPNTTYRQLVAGGFGVLHREAYDAYVTSNAYYNSSGEFIAKYAHSDGIGVMYMLGGVFSFNSYSGSVSAGSAYAVSEKFRITSGGNVGINETAPITKLDLRLDSTSTDLTADYAMFINNQTGASSGRHATIGFGTYSNGGLTNVFGAVAEGTGAQSGFAFLTHNGGSLTEKVRIANDGDVGIGTTANLGKLSVNSGISSSSDDDVITIHQATTGADKPVAGFGVVIQNGGESTNAGDLTISTASGGSLGERMRIKSSGAVHIEATSNNLASLNVVANGSGQAPNDAKVYVEKDSSADWSFKAENGTDDFGYKAEGGGDYAILIANANASGAATFRLEFDGDILSANTSISSISDRRLKKDITNASSQWNDIKALNFVNYKWKKSTGRDDSIKYLGLIADEVESVSPSLIKIDAQSKEDIEAGVEDPEYKTVKYSIVWMKAVKALQEAMEKIETLETKVETLENA